MRTVEQKVYKVNELTEDIKEKVIEKFSDINVDFEWWEFIYEDAEQAGIKITSFDLDRDSYCEGNFINSALSTAEYIIKNHGKNCETYKTAKSYIDNLKSENEEVREEAEEEFLKSILEDYRVILQGEYDYLTSEQAIIETIEANEYEFLENGQIYR